MSEHQWASPRRAWPSFSCDLCARSPRPRSITIHPSDDPPDTDRFVDEFPGIRWSGGGMRSSDLCEGCLDDITHIVNSPPDGWPLRPDRSHRVVLDWHSIDERMGG